LNGFSVTRADKGNNFSFGAKGKGPKVNGSLLTPKVQIPYWRCARLHGNREKQVDGMDYVFNDFKIEKKKQLMYWYYKRIYL
jgi:hypothetical protein